MKIDKVIFTIDDNPHYFGFWSSISKHYKLRMNMIPKLFILGNDIDISKYDTTYGEIEVVQPLEDIPTIIQSLMAKFYFTKTEPNTTWMIGDLDLYPLQQHHFKETIENIDDDKYIHLNPYAYTIDWRNRFEGLAGYFHVAKGSVFIDELKLHRSFEEIINEIYRSNKYGIKFYNLGARPESKQASKDWGWFCCEEMYTGELLRNSDKLIEIPPKNRYTRLDRSFMVYNLNDIKLGRYIDFHAPRPYEEHSNIIESIIENIPYDK